MAMISRVYKYLTTPYGLTEPSVILEIDIVDVDIVD